MKPVAARLLLAAAALLFCPPAHAGEKKPPPEPACTGDGALLIKTDPAGAAIWLDDEQLPDRTPHTVEPIACGVHQVRVATPLLVGEMEVLVRADKVARIQVPLVQRRGTLRIVTRPPEAELFIDDHNVGRSPFIERVPLGERTLRAHMPGHVDALAVVKLEDAEGERVELELPRAGQLKVTVKPATARVMVDGAPVTADAAGKALDLLPGAHTVQADAPGYKTQQQSVTIEVEQQRTLELTLQPLTGSLTVTSAQPEAKITLVGAEAPATGVRHVNTPAPLELNPTPVGRYRVRVALAGFSEQLRTVEVKPDQHTEVAFDLKHAPASLAVDSEPPGALVHLQGAEEPLGRTPLRTSLPEPGVRSLTFELPGYVPQMQVASMERGKTAKVRVDLVPEVGALQLGGTPEGSTVRMEGLSGPAARTKSWTGTLPARRDKLPVGRYRSTATLTGHVTLVDEITVSKDETTSLDLHFRPLPARLKVTTVPPGATVYYDELDIPLGQTPLDTELSRFGKQHLRIALPHHREQRIEVALDPGQPRSLNLALELLPEFVEYRKQSKLYRISGWATAGLGVALAGTSALLFGLGAQEEQLGDEREQSYAIADNPEFAQSYARSAQQSYDDAAGLRRGGWITGGMAVASSVVAVVLFALLPEEPADPGAKPGTKPDATKVPVSITAGAGGAALGWRW